MATHNPRLVVRRLQALRTIYRKAAAKVKLALLDSLAESFPRDASDLLKLHEVLCFLRAYPDSPAVLERVERLLDSFPDRPEVVRARHYLSDTGISGTTIDYPFSYPMATWLAQSYPGGTEVVWQDYEDPAPLDRMMILLTAPAEHPGIDDEKVASAEWLANASSPGRTTLRTLIHRLQAVSGDELTRQHLYDSLQLPLRVNLSRNFPARTNAAIRVKSIHYQRRPLDRSIPDVRQALRRTPQPQQLTKRQTAKFIHLARACMVVRHRELEAFDYASPEAGILYHCGRGLQIVLMGLRPERRLFLEGVYAGLLLKNGMPIGYTLASGLFESSEVAYNLFETFRGGESAWIFGRVLAAVHHLFGSTDFTIMRYQIGYQNDEAIQSGAFWFYYPFGFRPRGRSTLRLMQTERAKIEQDPSYRCSPRVLRRLARENLYLHTQGVRDDVIGLFPYENVGHLVTRHIAEHYNGDHLLATQEATSNVARQLGVKDLERWPPDEREAFRRWCLLVELFPALERWSATDKRELVRIMRAKGGKHESMFVRLANAHQRLRQAIHELALGWPGYRLGGREAKPQAEPEAEHGEHRSPPLKKPTRHTNDAKEGEVPRS